MALRVRELTVEEDHAVSRLARAQKASARMVLRAKIIWQAAQGETVQDIADILQITEETVRCWITRFNASGLAGLQDAPRSGRPPTYTAADMSEVIATALTDPLTLGLPFGCWTLDRLAAYLKEAKAIPIRRNRIDEVLLAEGLRWRTQETWFGERVDPEFAEKRGPSKHSTRLPPSIV